MEVKLVMLRFHSSTHGWLWQRHRSGTPATFLFSSEHSIELGTRGQKHYRPNRDFRSASPAVRCGSCLLGGHVLEAMEYVLLSDPRRRTTLLPRTGLVLVGVSGAGLVRVGVRACEKWFL